MSLPPHLAERIRTLVSATSTEGFHVDHEAARHGGIALMGTIGSVWLMRPDGTLWDVDDDSGKPLEPLPAALHVLALVAGIERHPWLAELLPVRPPHACDCTKCEGRGRFFTTAASNGFILCHDCQGLGWVA